MPVNASQTASVPCSPVTSPVVTHSRSHTNRSVSEFAPVSPPGLEAPPLSPGTKQLLASLSPQILSFDQPPLLPSDLPTTAVDFPVTGPQTLPTSGIRPSGCFSTPTVNVKPSKPIPPEGVTNPFIDHPSARRTKKRKTRCIKATTKDITISFGDPSTFGEAVSMARTVLVGHVRGRAYTASRLTQWVKEIWGALLKELPEVHVLPRGWFSLHFTKEDYTDLVLAKYWHIETTSVLLKRWSPLFDPEREQIGAGPLWVRLPGLPLQYWSEEALIKIGNALGTYLDHDRTYVESKKQTLARVLVHLDTREGLEEKITLKWGKYSRTQILDYEGVPFRCNRCHQVGHLFKDCPLNKSPEASPRITPISAREASPVILRPTQGEASVQGSSAKTGSKGPGPSPPPMTRARAVAAVHRPRVLF